MHSLVGHKLMRTFLDTLSKRNILKYISAQEGV